MNGYKLIADGYRKLVQSGQFAEEDVKRKIEIYDFLSTCTHSDFSILVDSSAFNDIMAAYTKKAAKNIGLGEDIEKKLAKELHCLFDEISASEIMEEA